ncbi:MAG: SMC-Scp complex subunit ScpB [Deferrisomatales bacterium]
MERDALVRAVEAVLFVSPEPVPMARLEELFAPEGVDRAALREAVRALQGHYAGRGVEVREVGGGFQMRTHAGAAPWLARLKTPKPVRFSRAAMECLSLVAYRQPVTRAEVEEVRGVDSGGVMKSLLEKGLVRIVGKKDVPGRPLLYGTTRRFLEVFGLGSLSELPSLRDIQELLDEQGEGVTEALEAESGEDGGGD